MSATARSAELHRPSTLVGQRVLRVNDPKLLTGKGRYVDDLHPAGLVHAVVLRSPLPHGRVVGVDASAALAHPEVVDVLTPADAAVRTRPLPCVWVLPGQRQTEYPVVPSVVTYQGQALGVVVARTRAAAEDAAELVRIDVDPLPPVADALEALEPDAPRLNAGWPGNVVFDMDRGEPREVVEQAVADAPHVVERDFRVQRLFGLPLEPRGVLATWNDGTEELVVHSSTQVPHHARDHLAHALRLPVDRVRVIAPDVGGGFGPKDHLYPDEVLVALAAIRVGRPVKWIEDRREAFTATVHGRDHRHHARLGFDGDGTFLVLDSDVVADLGAHPSNVGGGPAFVATGMLEGPYRFPVAGGRIRGVVTNKTPSGAYRGFGMQQATWVRERLVDEAARELGMDPVELRLRNMLGPADLPYTSHTHQNYDSGDYPTALRRAAERIRVEDPPPGSRSVASPAVRRGTGFSSYVEFTGLGPSKVQELVGFAVGGYESAVVRVEPDGSVTLLTGVCPHGQGLETSLAQLAADALGVGLEAVTVVFGDTATAPYSSGGTVASRSMAVGGGAVVRASGRLRQKILRVAAHMLEAAEGDLEIADGRISVRGSPDAQIALAQLAEKAWLGWGLPEGEQPGLEDRDIHDPADISYSYATHAAAVSVDLGTGRLEIERYVVVHDCGVVVNPMIVDGQVHGGVAQGIGNALTETLVFDADARPLVDSLHRYVVPTTRDVPDIDIAHLETPSPFVPGGMKGMGEGGTIAPAAAIGNALADAVPEIAERITETPLTPARVLGWLQDAGVASED